MSPVLLITFQVLPYASGTLSLGAQRSGGWTLSLSVRRCSGSRRCRHRRRHHIATVMIFMLIALIAPGHASMLTHP